MTEEMTQFAREGENTLNLDSEKENSAASSAGEETSTEETQSHEGEENTQGEADKDIPFHEHPAWKEREEAWNKRFNEQESRHQDDLKAIRQEFGTARKDNAESTQIPAWFGGNQQQWDDYRKYEDERLKTAEENAINRLKGEKETQDKAVQEATAFMQSELVAIQSDKTLNPEGKKIDPQKLLQFVLDNDLVDSQGRWNYRAGFRLMNASAAPKPKPPVTEDKKKLAAATGSESRAEQKAPNYKTSKDFEKNRPW